MTMLTWSTTGQSQSLKNSNVFELKHYYKFISILMTHSIVKNLHVFETYYKFKYPTHFQVRKNNIET